MKVIGAGLSKTGTRSLHEALRALGLRSLHYDRVRLTDILDGSTTDPDFRRYDDVDAVVDLPAAWFFEELLIAYPQARCVLTVRDEDAWWASIEAHANELLPVTSYEQDPFRWLLRHHVYGSTRASRFLYRKRYREHNERVRRVVAPDRLLEMDIARGDGWDRLCPFLGMERPDMPFPHEHRRADLARAVRASWRS